MRILLTTDTIGGVWTFTKELTTELLQRGHAVALVSLGCQPSHEQQAWCAAQSLTHGASFQFTASNVPLEWMEKNEFVHTQGAGVLLHVARQFRPDCCTRISSASERFRSIFQSLSQLTSTY